MTWPGLLLGLIVVIWSVMIHWELGRAFCPDKSHIPLAICAGGEDVAQSGERQLCRHCCALCTRQWLWLKNCMYTALFTSLNCSKCFHNTSQHTHIHTVTQSHSHTHTHGTVNWRYLGFSIFCPRTLWHVDQRSQGIEPPTLWLVDDPLYLLAIRIPASYFPTFRTPVPNFYTA